MVEILKQRLDGKKVLLLGFGREGESSYRLIRNVWPEKKIWIADRNPAVPENPVLASDPHVEFRCGDHYLGNLDEFDLILKSPGVSLVHLNQLLDPGRITSQTALFLEAYASQTTGITGTKGKSTTSSLIYHLLLTGGKDTILLGNIGTPAWHFLDRIIPETLIVDELSSHQLEYIHHGPHIAILLNIFEEHLDAYASYQHYQLAKMKITTTQDAADFLLYNADDALITRHLGTPRTPLAPLPSLSPPAPQPTLLPLSLHQEYPLGAFTRNGELIVRIPGRDELIIHEIHNRYLKGEHNLRNIMAAVSACWLQGVSEEAILDGIASFKGLAHRMESIGLYHGIHWVNDSIATIPEACIAALQSLPDVDTLILGGFDRGIGYEAFASRLLAMPVRTLILVGAAGRRIGTEMEKQDQAINSRKNLFYINRFDHFLPIALEHTRPGAICLLSPAASSYDEFRSFEERGFRFRDLVVGCEGVRV